MRWNFRAISRFRPRLLTLVVLIVIAVLLALANITDELVPRSVPRPAEAASDWNFDVRKAEGRSRVGGAAYGLSYGWPLLWGQYVIYGDYGPVVVGWRYDVGRLTADIAMWLLMLAAAGAMCHWLLHNYEPRARWSLRSMLTAIALAGLFLGWFAWSRDRANREDALIDAIRGRGGEARLARWGPQWLDFIGGDRYRRHIVAATVRIEPTGDKGTDGQREARQLLERLSESRDLRYFFIEAFELTPDITAVLGEFSHLRRLAVDSRKSAPGAMAALGQALRQMPELRILRISPGANFSGTDDDCLRAVANARQVEALRLAPITIGAEGLSQLASLTNLKSLNLDIYQDADMRTPVPILSQLPELPLLEAIELDCDLGDDDLADLARQPRLRSLRFAEPRFTAVGFRKLAACASLEELSLGRGSVSPAILQSLCALKGLKRLHMICDSNLGDGLHATIELVPRVRPAEFEESLNALQELRQTHPGIVIDDEWQTVTWPVMESVPSWCDTVDRLSTKYHRELVRRWKAAGSPPYLPRTGGGMF